MEMDQAIPRERVFFDNLSQDQVLLNDLFQYFGSATVVPDAFRINHSDGAAAADTQAVDLGSVNQWLRANELQFLESRFQVFPRSQSGLARTAVRFGLISAEKDVAREFFETKSFRNLAELVIHSKRAGKLFWPSSLAAP